MPAFFVVIPARFASSRLPGKPLLSIAGKPMIQHVYERASASSAAEIIVATDDRRIAAACADFGAQTCLTRADHSSGTDRIAEVVDQMGWPDTTIVVNLQGDEPLMPAALVDQVAADLAAHPQAQVATLATPLEHADRIHDENLVKAVLDQAGYALYFSRAAIPWRRGEFAAPNRESEYLAAGMLRHIGLYAYRAALVREFVRWRPAPIEEVEALEQLRVLWYGRRIHVSVTPTPPPPGVDTAEDLARVVAALTRDSAAQ